ncbi:MAG: Hpt domain-containing protein [Oscillospiraceae bacterium]|jgi:HPt (histidine-containing phosphotransfer) domain-containing protein|nr:Hpt domain-containing protein [Oscillospiraceae bacterium]
MFEELLLIDEKDGLGRVMNNAALYKKLLRVFVAGEELHAVGAALKTFNVEQIESASHMLKGLSGSLGCMRLAAICTEINNSCKAGNLPEMSVFGAYSSILTETTAEIDKYLNAG